MSPTVIDLLLVLSVLLLVFSLSWLFMKLKGESRSLLDQFQNLFEQFKIINRSSELISSAHAPSDILNVITIELSKIIGNCAVGVIMQKEGEVIQVVSGTEPFKKWVKQVTLNIIGLQEFWHGIKANKVVEIRTPANPISVQSAVFMPIIIKGNAVGVLSVLSLEKPRIFTEEDKNYMKLFASQASIVIENKNQADRENEYKQELLGINAITVLGLLTLDSNELMEVFVSKFSTIMKADSAVLFTRISRSSDYTVSSTSGIKYKKEAELMNENIELINEVFASGKASKTEKRIGLPLTIRNEVFGCMVLYKEKIEEKEFLFCANLAQKASIILERTKMNEANNMIINELSAISYIGNVILSTLRLDDVLNLISKSVCEMMDAKGSTLRLLNNKKQELELCVSYGLSSKLVNEENQKNFTASEREVIKSLQIVEVPDIEKSEYKAFKQLNEEGIKSLVCIPLLAKNRVIGILTLYFRYKRDFTENDKKLMIIFTSHTAIAIENTRLFKSWKEMYINVIKSFATALDGKDTYTKGHSEGVLRYATDIALEMKLKEEEMELLQYSAILHDIGKIGIADEILKKPAKLTREEYEIIKKHPTIGSNILVNIEEFKEVANIIMHHHEAFGGKGYPNGLKSDEIPLLSRIITVVDSFEAMTSDRPYRKAMDHAEALKELEINKNIQFDPEIVDIFKKVLAKKIL